MKSEISKNDFGSRFGALIAQKREERGWSLRYLALEAYGDDGVGGDTRKADVQKIEAGYSRKPNAATIKRYREALDLTQEEIDACRTPAELELAHYADRLFAVIEGAATQAGVNEDLTAQITERYAAGNPNDFDAALKGLQRALDVAAKHPPKTNQPTEVDDIISEVDRLNREDDLETGASALKAALVEQRQKEAEQAKVTGRLLAKAIEQAVLERNVKDAADYSVEMLNREYSDPVERFIALLELEQDIWLARGRDKGLNFELEVAISLTGHLINLATTADQRNAAFAAHGTALRTIGEREREPTRLKQSVSAYEAALLGRIRDSTPLAWAATQNDLGLALQALGARVRDPALLEQAVAAYEAVLQERTRDRVPQDWAMTQNNLGNALVIIGQGESDPVRLEQAVAAYEAALQENIRGRVPLDWAMTQNNLGNALAIIGEREKDPSRLEQAIAAYEAALKERTFDRVPLDWAKSFGNHGVALSLLAERVMDVAKAERAVQQIAEAEVVMRDAEHVPAADHFAEQLQLAEARLAALKD